MRYGAGDEVRPRVAEAARRVAALREAMPFRVLGAVGAAPEPAWLAECHRVDERWQRITLLHGRLDAAPAVWVTSAVHDAEPVGLAESLRLERDGYPGFDAGASPTPDSSGQQMAGRTARADLVVDGAAVAAEVLTEGTWWAARVVLDTVTVTVVGHRFPLTEVRLATVTGLGPYLDGREAELARRRGQL
ncbi:hypothetical protein ABZ901_20305 [Actinacidiphila alni]|uniref:hypothetical protein n=1 Tax=Actinacidiphila alni TaxID=380248 RepID=UPI0033F90825